MDKDIILEIVSNTIENISKMAEKAKLIQDGISLHTSSCQRDPKECSFGKWFYTEGQKLKKFSNNPMECLQNIELLHNEFHIVFFEIVDIYEKTKKKNGLFGMFAKKVELPKDKIEKLVNELENAKEKLLAELNRMYRRIQATPQEKFEQL